jgi:hypothetical protein
MQNPLGNQTGDRRAARTAVYYGMLIDLVTSFEQAQPSTA